MMGCLGFDVDEENYLDTPTIPSPSDASFNHSLSSLALLTPPGLPSPGMWPPRLSFDVALGIEDEETIRNRYGYTEKEFSHILVQPTFRTELATHYSVLRETGATFAVKAKLIAEEKLEDMYRIISNVAVDPKVRMETWKAVTKAAGLEERTDKGIQANAQTVNIQINY
jgi:hypothetical protein